MSKERKSLNPGKLQLDMLSDGISGSTASYLMDHELKHSRGDEVGRGEFGYFASGGYIIAYYLIIGPRTSEQLIDIASAPGFSQMSDQLTYICLKRASVQTSRKSRKMIAAACQYCGSSAILPSFKLNVFVINSVALTAPK